MYKRVPTTASAYLWNGIEINPVVTFVDEFQAVHHIWVERDCYVAGILCWGSPRPSQGAKHYVRVTDRITPELHDVLKTLPSLAPIEASKGAWRRFITWLLTE